MTAGLDPKRLRIGVEIEDQRRRAHNCDNYRAIAQIASTAANGEASIGELLASAFTKVGNRGVINLEPGHGIEDAVEFQDGAHWGQGWLSPYFITEKIRRIAELQSPYVLLYDRIIQRFEELIPLFEQIRKVEGSLLIVAEDVEDAALTGILLNHIRCVLKAVAVKPPGFGDHRADTLVDLAHLVGGRALRKSSGDDLTNVKLTDLGRAESVVISEESTALFGGAGDQEKIAARIRGLQTQAERLRNGDASKASPTGKAHDLEGLSERIETLSAITAKIRVGAVSDTGLKKRRQRFDNAKNAVSAALSEGGLPGGGVGLLRCRRALRSLTSSDRDISHGIAIVADAVGEPLRLICARSVRMREKTPVRRFPRSSTRTMNFGG